MRLRSMLFCCLAGLAACQNESPDPASAPPSADGFVSLQRGRLGYNAAGTPTPAALSAVVVSRSELSPITLIRTASASIEVDSLEPAVALVRQLATRIGGYVAGTAISAGKNQLRSARIEVKIPAARFDESLSGLEPIGKLEDVTVNAEDVGEQFVDVTARMENARRLERRLIELLATRTGKLKDVLDVEQSLARVREEIERYEGRIRYLKAHTATSTLSIYVHEPVPVVGSAGHSVLGEAFRQAWRNFVALVAVAVQSLGVVIPLGAVALMVWAFARQWRRTVRQPSA
jgi:Domain of unknown function (DUF4349)